VSSPFAVPARVVKSDAKRQIAFSVVLEPRTSANLDAQADYYDADEIEKAAHGFLEMVAKGEAAADLMHDDGPAVGYPVESFIAPVDFVWGEGERVEVVKAGSWVMGIHYPDPDLWADIEKGRYTALSVAGHGIRIVEEG
jgi:hypothetical protein